MKTTELMINQSYHVFSSNGENTFLFDSETLAVFKIEDRELVGYLKEGGNSDVIQAEIATLLKTAKFPVRKIIDKHPFNLTLNISGKCNLACTYCFASNIHHSFDFGMMDFETAKRAIDFVVTQRRENQRHHINFFGGEPMLNFDIIEEVIMYCRDTYSNIPFSFAVTTNGTILDNRMTDVLKKYNIAVLVSIDGPEKITNKNRPAKNKRFNTYTSILKNLTTMKAKGIYVELRATATFQKDSNITQLADFFEKLGYPFHIAYLSYTSNKENMNLSMNVDNINKQFDDYLKYYKKRIMQNKTVLNSSLKTALTDIRYRKIILYACGAGRTHITVNANGDIYNCMNFANNLKFKTGNVNNITSFNELINNFYPQDVRNITKCQTCWAKYVCLGACMAESYDFHGKHEPIDNKCKLIKMRIETHLALYAFLCEKNPDYVKNLGEGKYQNIDEC